MPPCPPVPTPLCTLWYAFSVCQHSPSSAGIVGVRFDDVDHGVVEMAKKFFGSC